LGHAFAVSKKAEYLVVEFSLIGEEVLHTAETVCDGVCEEWATVFTIAS
jgi:hypothetical protein